MWGVIGSMVVAGLAGLGLVNLIEDGLDKFRDDPRVVYIDKFDREVNPKELIERSCEHSLERVVHLDEGSVELWKDWYQRWVVIPKPGHPDRVLLNTTTGKTICP